MGFTESEFVAWVTAGGAPGIPVGPGDDAAVLPGGGVVSVDSYVEGVHFASTEPMDLVARKALGATLSDLAAMGARPQALFVAAQLPAGCDGRALADALVRWARFWDVPIAGGDTSATRPGALALALTVVGRCAGPPWLRSGARPGDRLAVSGALGGSRSGRHLRVRPRFDIVEKLRTQGPEPHAALDLSDGLGRDLPRLCLASGVGAAIFAERLPIHPDVDRAREPVEAALGDGEDFELLLALPPEGPLPSELVVIGEARASSELLLLRHGLPEPWPSLGYEHAF